MDTAPHAGWPEGTDPYLRWALASQWRGIGRHVGQWPVSSLAVRLLIEAPAQADTLARLVQAHGLRIPAFYPAGARQLSATVARSRLKDLAQALHALNLRWELAVPFRSAELRAQATPLGYYPPDQRSAALPRPGLPAALPRSREPASPPFAAQPWLAVIDFGFPLLHDAFSLRGEGLRTRIQAVWDQGDDRKPTHTPWRVDGLPYGRRLEAADVQDLLALRNHGALADTQIYRALGWLVDWDDARRRVLEDTHGAHIADLAGGWRDPLQPDRALEGSDAAGAAPLLLVQLPSLTAADASGSSLGAQVLDALRFCLAQAPQDAPLIVNLSYGTTASSLRGDSLIEEAIDALLQEHPRLAVVMAAGNAWDTGCHVQRRVAPDKGMRQAFRLAAVDTTDTFIECWYDRGPERLELRVRPPGADWSPWVAQGGEWTWHGTPAEAPVGPAGAVPRAWLRHQAEVPQSRSRAMALLAIAPTAPTRGDAGPLAPGGEWELELRVSWGGPLTVDLCLEWDEIDDRNPPEALTALLGIEAADRDETLNSLGHGRRTLLVGACRRPDGRLARYSAVSRALGKPQLCAAVEDGDGPAGVFAASGRNGCYGLSSGTSAAAAAVSRRLVNWCAAGGRFDSADWLPTVQALLQADAAATAQDPRGPALRAAAV